MRSRPSDGQPRNDGAQRPRAGAASRPGAAASPARRSPATDDYDWQTHPSVNSARPCPWCSTPALHEQHCKQICLACGWYRSCVD